MNKEIFFPYKATLTKIGVIGSSTTHQLDKYPIGYTKVGLVWNFNYPRVNEPFQLHESKLYPIFKTTTVKEIIEIEDSIIESDAEIENKIILTLTTLNSVYQLELDSAG